MCETKTSSNSLQALPRARFEKQDPDKLKNLTPKAGEVFKPPAATMITT